MERSLNRCFMSHILLRLPNGKSVRNINDYKLEMICLRNKDIPQPTPDVNDSSQISVKTVLHIYIDEFNPTCQDTDTLNISCQSPWIFQNTILDGRNNLLHLYHVHSSVITSTDALKDTIFSPDEPLQGSCNSFTVSKSRFKFGDLQIFAIITPGHGKLSQVILKTILLQVYWVKITGSGQKYVSQRFEYL